MKHRQNRIIVEKCDCGNGRNWHYICYMVNHIPPQFFTSIHSGNCFYTWQEAIEIATAHGEAYNPFKEIIR